MSCLGKKQLFEAVVYQTLKLIKSLKKLLQSNASNTYLKKTAHTFWEDWIKFLFEENCSYILRGLNKIPLNWSNTKKKFYLIFILW